MTDTNKQQYILGLDVGGTKCAVIVGDRGGNVLDRVAWASEVARGPHAMIDELCEKAQVLIARYGGAGAFSGVGISIGGPLDAAEGIVYEPPNLPGWVNIALPGMVSERLGVQAKMEHDAAACALAETLWGAGRGLSRVAYLTCGSGFGCGLVVDGKIYRGARGRSPEIGHVRYRADGPSAFGKVGSFEAFAAGNSLPKLAAWMFAKRWGNDPPSGEVLTELWRAGDKDAEAVIMMNARATGDACALVGDLLIPDVILLGSLARYLGDAWVEAVKRQFALEVSEDVARHCEVRASELGEKLQDCSALAVGM